MNLWWRWVVAWVAVLAIAVGLSLGASSRDRFPGDLRITREVQSWPQPVEFLSGAVRAITSTEVVVAAGAGLVLILFAARRPWFALTYAALFLALPLVQRGIKAWVDRPRPPADLVDIRGSATSPSFPSGHVMSGSVLFGALVLLAWFLPLPPIWRRTAAGLAIVLGLANCVANVYEGVHWPSDVAGGLAWAAVLLLPAWAAMAAIRTRAKR